MDSTVVQTVSGVLDELAARFGSTSAHLWAELARYEFAGAIVDVCLPAVTVILAFAVACVAYRAMAEEIPEEPQAKRADTDAFVLCVVALFVMVVAFVAFAALLPGAVRTLASPEAAVLKSLF